MGDNLRDSLLVPMGAPVDVSGCRPACRAFDALPASHPASMFTPAPFTPCSTGWRLHRCPALGSDRPFHPGRVQGETRATRGVPGRARLPGPTRASTESFRLAFGLLLATFLAPGDLDGASPTADLPDGSPSLVAGQVLDARRGTPVPGARIVLLGVLSRIETLTAAGGHFHVELDSAFTPLNVGGTSPHVRIEVEAPGYLPWSMEHRLADPEGGRLRIALEPNPFRMEALEVRTRAFGAASVFEPAAIIDARQLAERMATSLAATLVGEPGVTMRTNGPMASQPVIRGLTGDRVVVLEDGLRTGDIATTAPDHAVTLEPATAGQVEILRGPVGLLHSSNTLGGVVNVRRNLVPHERAEGTSWRAASHLESVNRGAAASGWAGSGRGPWVLRGDGALRRTADTRTPGGIPLPFTDVEVADGGLGGAWIGDDLRLGGAVRGYRASYGVPSSFEGMTLPGSHVGGVYVDAHRLSARAEADWTPRSTPPSSHQHRIEGISAGANAVRFEQWEFERGGFIGTRFGQLAGGGDVVLRHAGPDRRGAVGASVHWQDLRAEGSFTGTRPATHRTLSAYALEEIQGERVQLLAGLRVDRVDLVPLDSTETLLVRDIRTRSFTAWTGAAGIRTGLGAGWTAHAYLARAFRPPSIEELFSAGPHLASYAYEIGNPSLDAEEGWGVDLVLRHAGPMGRFEVTGFAMFIDGYIAYAPVLDPETGRLLRDPRLRRYVVYRPEQVGARIQGLELRLQRMLSDAWGMDLAADWIRGSAEGEEALAQLPPASARLEFRRLFGAGSLALSLDGRLPHRAVPPPPAEAQLTCTPRIENDEVAVLPSHFCPTAGRLLVGGVASAPLPATWLPWETRVTVGVENLLDQTWRDPLWRAKDVAPQPGRNLRVSLQILP